MCSPLPANQPIYPYPGNVSFRNSVYLTSFGLMPMQHHLLVRAVQQGSAPTAAAAVRHLLPAHVALLGRLAKAFKID